MIMNLCTFVAVLSINASKHNCSLLDSIVFLDHDNQHTDEKEMESTWFPPSIVFSLHSSHLFEFCSSSFLLFPMFLLSKIEGHQINRKGVSVFGGILVLIFC